MLPSLRDLVVLVPMQSPFFFETVHRNGFEICRSCSGGFVHKDIIWQARSLDPRAIIAGEPSTIPVWTPATAIKGTDCTVSPRSGSYLVLVPEPIHSIRGVSLEAQDLEGPVY